MAAGVPEDPRYLRDVRLPALTCARAVLLAGPVVLAFFSGGYFDEPRIWAGLGAWALVAVAAIASPPPFPRSRQSLLTLGGLAALAVWTLLSYTWAPLAGTAYHDGQRVILYAGVLLAAATLLQGRSLAVVEPAVAAGTLVVVGYGLSERLLPGLLHFHHSFSAEGRLEQPLTYWNAMGAVAAIGVVLCARLAGDQRRSTALRCAAATAAAPLGLGLYLSFSRGALFACAAGLVTLLVMERTREGGRALILTWWCDGRDSLCAAPFERHSLLDHHRRVVQGTVTLVALVAVCLAAASIQRLIDRRERSGRLRTGALALPRRAGPLAVVVVIGSFGVFLLAGAKEQSGAHLSGGASRLTSLQSNRYSYWRVAWRAFKAEPIHGVGGGGWPLLAALSPVRCRRPGRTLAVHPDAARN